MLDRARIVGNLCYLRPFERTDLSDAYLSWVNKSSSTNQLLGSIFPVTRQMLDRFFETSQPPGAVLFAVCDCESGLHIGNARLYQIDWVNRWAHYGWMIGEHEYRGRGYGTEALVLLLRYGFHQLGLNRIWAGVAAENQASLKSSQRAGMVSEGVLRQYIWSNGRFHDAVIFSILRSEFDMRYGPSHVGPK